ncbi:anthranilate synthase family protein [Streptantibioticus silvisoli]|uniref:anthranilate synthase n=1 Tax=Streptantibioticus silvisoli TaxID=2705255 RepID=A0ABT6VSG5_9ACTN|nr:anthranilate synthase family protein [Streptantibioticus silvisoli]MDI5961418.1 anthranilate synthase family protein [Streptantibioticus silvisoli]
MPDTTTPAALLERLLAPGCPPFALLRRRTPGHPPGTVEVLTGPLSRPVTLDAIALPDGVPEHPGPDALAVVPFRQIAERGFEAVDDGTPLLVMRPEEYLTVDEEALRAALPHHAVTVAGGGFDLDDDAYARMVERVITDEIGRGEGANFVIRRTYRGRITGFRVRDALALFGRLLSGERSAYWTFLVHTGDRTLIGASPEVHVRASGGTVVMNPISGTYRYPPAGPDTAGLLAFLADPKEAEELTMVVDEELKMMSVVCERGGVVVGPRLREMAHLAHTEFELRGRGTRDVRDVLRETMFAATVTGSPVENACRVIARHECAGRGYYGGALALIGRDAGGARTLDSPILLRTADIAADGTLAVGVGATLVRHSDPYAEAAETHAKAGGVLTALGVLPPAARPERAAPPRLARDPRVRAALDARRGALAPFWLRMRDLDAPAGPRPEVLLIDAEDTFTAMLAHLWRAAGHPVTVRRFDDPGLRAAAVRHRGPVVLGPGPGDPGDTASPRMRSLRSLAADLVRDHRYGLLGVCLGHELIAARLGLEIVRRDLPFQGAQERVDLFGQPETVGFYNTFTARCEESTALELTVRGVELARDPATGDVHALRGPGFAGVQFHPESVLTMNGPAIVTALLSGVTVG